MFVKTYAILGCIIGFLELLEGLVWIFNGQAVSSANIALSLIELLWLIVSLIAFVFFYLARKWPVSPALFVAYYALVWISAWLFMSLDPAYPKRLQSGHADLFAIVHGTLFGALYLTVNFLLYRSLKNSDTAGDVEGR